MMQAYAEYKDSGVDWLGEIPAGWEVKRLRRLVREHSGYGFPVDLQGDKNGTVPFLKVSDFSSANRLISSSNNSVSEKTIKNRNWNKVPAGSLVTAKIGEALRKNHRNLLAVDSLIDNNCIAFQPTDLDLLFCFYLHRIIDFDWFVNPGAVPSISVPKYKSLKVPVPPLPEQTAIANFLDDKTAKIEALVGIKRRQIELLTERKQILIQNAVTKGLNPDAPMKDSGIDWLGEIPAHWEVKRLASFGRFSKGGGFSKSDLANTGTNAVLYGDIYTKYDFAIDRAVRTISPKVADKSVWIKQGDLLFTGSGETKEDIGKCVLFRGSTRTVAGGDVILFRQLENHPLFLSFCLNTNGAVEQKARSSKGEIIVHTYASKLKNIFIPIPPVDEQEEIAKFVWDGVEKINAAIKIKENQITKLNEYKTTLINAAVTGKIRVT